MEITALGSATSSCLLLQTPRRERSTCSRGKRGSFSLASSHCNRVKRFMDLYLLKCLFRCEKTCRNKMTLHNAGIGKMCQRAGCSLEGAGGAVFPGQLRESISRQCVPLGWCHLLSKRLAVAQLLPEMTRYRLSVTRLLSAYHSLDSSSGRWDGQCCALRGAVASGGQGGGPGVQGGGPGGKCGGPGTGR